MDCQQYQRVISEVLTHDSPAPADSGETSCARVDYSADHCRYVSRRINSWPRFALVHVVAVLLAVLSLLCVPIRAMAEPVDTQTRAMLDAIFNSQRANRGSIRDLTMTGRITLTGSRENDTWQEVIDYQHFRLNDLQRTDHAYTKVEGSADSWKLAGTVRRLVLNGKRTLRYTAESDLASIWDAHDYSRTSLLTNLDVTTASVNYQTYAGQIEYLLDRGWVPQKENISVQQVEREGRSVLRVHYESTRGKGTTIHDWYFDPRRGYEVVGARMTGTYPDGRPLLSESAKYELREVAEGIWLPVNAEIEKQSWDEKGQASSWREQVVTAAAQANAGQVAESLFAFGGMGVPIGTLVVDHTFSPTLEFQFGAPPSSEDGLDFVLQGDFTPSAAIDTGSDAGSASSETAPVDSNRPSSSTDSSGPAQATLTATEAAYWIGGGLLVLLGALIAYWLVMRRWPKGRQTR